MHTTLFTSPIPLFKTIKKEKLKGTQRIYLQNYLKKYKTKNVVLNLKNAKKEIYP